MKLKQINQYQKSAANFFVGAFGVVILTISAVTTFSFFSTYFTAIFPTGMLGYELASLMAGGAGVVLFDLASVYWLNTFLKHAETSEQRGISLIMLIVTFVGAAGASIAQLGLAASGDVSLDPATRQSIANASVWTVIAGVVSNFGANIAYGRYSLASKHAVMEADRRDMIQDAEDEQAKHLDGLITQQVKELLTTEAVQLSREQANRVVDAFRRREMAKYAGTGTTEPFYRIEELKNGMWVHVNSSTNEQAAKDKVDEWVTKFQRPYRATLNDGVEIYRRMPKETAVSPTLSKAAQKWMWMADNGQVDGVGSVEWTRRVGEEGHDPHAVEREITMYRARGGRPIKAPWQAITEPVHQNGRPNGANFT